MYFINSIHFTYTGARLKETSLGDIALIIHRRPGTTEGNMLPPSSGTT